MKAKISMLMDGELDDGELADVLPDLSITSLYEKQNRFCP